MRACLASWSREGADAQQQWLVRLMRESGPGLVRLLWRMLENEHDVLETYQECVCRLLALERPGSLRNARAYAYRTASNLAIELIRRRTRRQAHWPEVIASQEGLPRGRECARGDVAGIAAQRELVQQLRACILALPAHLRDVVILRDLGALSYAEVGRILSIGAATARVYRCQAMARLTETLPGNGEEETRP